MVAQNKIISVFGGYGFVLGEFCRQFPEHIIRVPKPESESPTPTVLYGISTVHNYHVFDSPTLDIETNLLHFMEVLSSSHKKHGKNLDFTLISTWFVYGVESTKDNPLRETSYCNPRGFYSITARAREQLLISYCETFGIKYKILRLANVMGWRDAKVSSQKNAIQWIMDKVLHNESVELYDNGEVYREIIDVRDCAQAIMLAMGNDKYNLYNISNGNSSKVRDIIQHTIDYSGSTSTIWENQHKPEFHSVVQAKNAFINNDRLKEIGYVPKYTINETIEAIVEQHKK